MACAWHMLDEQARGIGAFILHDRAALADRIATNTTLFCRFVDFASGNAAMVRLDFCVELEYEVMQASNFEFIVHAAQTSQQHVVRERFEVWPRIQAIVETSPLSTNRHTRLCVEPGPLRVRYSAVVDIEHHFAQPAELHESPIAEMPLEALHYLRPSRYCPSDRFYQIAMDEFHRLAPGYRRVEAIADWVRNRTRFQPGTTNSLHCAMDTYVNQVGVCRDFAHLMISLCRALNIPARYATGIDYGADPALGPMDFHAYVEVYLFGRWYIFDPTGIALTTGLIRLATGRDASDVPFATIFGAARWSMPRITMIALEDAAAGIALPAPTALAVSSSAPSHEGHTRLEECVPLAATV